MAITNFIPTIWSEHFQRHVAYKRIAVNHCNRVFEGEIREKGSTVRVCGLGIPMISDYERNKGIAAPSILNAFHNDLVINQAKYFNFMIDDIDRAQADPKMMDFAISNTTAALANTADQYIYSLWENAQDTYTVVEPTVDNILDLILDARAMFYYGAAPDLDDVIIEVSPKVASLILKAKMKYGSDNTEVLEKGCIGRIGGCKVFVSTNVARVFEDGSYEYHKCMMRSSRAIAFAEQFSEVEAYRPEAYFADAVRGLYLFGAKVMVPAELTVFNFGFEVN